MEEHLYTLLSALGWPVAWGVVPQGTALPHVALLRVSGADDLHLQGRSGWARGRVQVDCYAASYAVAIGMRRAITEALSGYHGGPVMRAAMIGTRDLPYEAGGDVIQRVSLDFAVEYRE